MMDELFKSFMILPQQQQCISFVEKRKRQLMVLKSELRSVLGQKTEHVILACDHMLMINRICILKKCCLGWVLLEAASKEI